MTGTERENNGGAWGGLRASDLLFAGIIAVAFFLLLLSNPNIPGGDDAYRHVKFASRLIRDPRDALSQPWKLLYFWPKPVDAWFGYHLLLAPFTLVFGLILSAKTLAALVYGAQTWVLLAIMKHAGVYCRKAWVVLALAGSAMALWRASLSRPFLLSVVLVLAAAYFTIRERPLAVALVSAFHAFAYSMFFMVAFAPGTYLILRRTKGALKVAVACSVGLMVGLLCNPTLPENIRFDVAQLLSPLTVKVRLNLEMMPMSMDVINPSRALLIVWVFSLLRAAWVWRKEGFSSVIFSTGSLLLLCMSLLSFGVSLAVVRMFDYFAPLASLTSAVILTPWILSTPRIRRDAAAAAAVFAVLCAFNVVSAYKTIRDTTVAARFQGVSEYLLAHAPRATVFNTQWEQYHLLYFWNSQSTYIVGIDPSFLYHQNPRLYWLWRHIGNEDASTCGLPKCTAADSTDVLEVVADDFDAEFVVVEHDKNPRLDEALRSHEGFREVYRDWACSLFGVVHRPGTHR